MRFERTVGRILALAAAAVPNRLSVTLGDESLTFTQSEQRATRMANALSGIGLRHGDRVMYCGAISLREVDVFFATQKLGVVFVPFKDSLLPSEVATLIRYVRPALLIGDAILRQNLAEVGESCGVRIATVNGTGPGIDLEAAYQQASDRPIDCVVDDEDIHAIFLTSGSTGQSKGVMVSHRASWSRSFSGATRTPSCGGGGEINMFPLFHWAGWNFLLIAWTHLRTIHLTAKVDANSIATLLDRWKPESMYAIPAIWERLLGHDRPFENRSLRWARTGTSRFEPDLIDRIKHKFPLATCTSSWGATELGTGAIIGDSDLSGKPYSVGLPTPGMELRIQDGELMGRSDQMMTGYFDLPEMTREAVVDGWYMTGDLAEKDKDGFVSIVGRRREVIRSGAETIAPAEVEAAIAGLPGVEDVAIVGLPDPIWGEIVCAAVVVGPGEILPSIDTIKHHLASRLAAYKHPRKVVQVDALPRTPATGQIQRTQLRSALIAQPEFASAPR